LVCHLLPEHPIPDLIFPALAPLIIAIGATHFLFGRPVAATAAAIIALLSIIACGPELGDPKADLWLLDRILASFVPMLFPTRPDAHNRLKASWRGLCAISARVRNLARGTVGARSRAAVGDDPPWAAKSG
jgi:hypothetical protein